MGSDSYLKMNNNNNTNHNQFYRQPWFFPVCTLVIIIIYLQIMPTVKEYGQNQQ